MHADSRDTPAVLPKASRVSSNDSGSSVATIDSGTDTPDTAPEIVRYQAKPAWPLGRTLDTPATPEKINTEGHTANEVRLVDLLTTTPAEPKRFFRRRGPWLTGAEQSAAQAYHAHHFNCHPCITAGQSTMYGGRCAVGLALWNSYLKA